MNTDIHIVTITRVLTDGSHVSLGNSTSSIDQLVATLDAMTTGKEIVDDIFSRQTITVMDDAWNDPTNSDSVNRPTTQGGRSESSSANRYMAF